LFNDLPNRRCQYVRTIRICISDIVNTKL